MQKAKNGLARRIAYLALNDQSRMLVFVRPRIEEPRAREYAYRTRGPVRPGLQILANFAVSQEQGQKKGGE